MRTCRKCKLKKSFNEFYLNNYYCKTCIKTRNCIYRLNNVQKIREASLIYRQKNKSKYLVNNWKQRGIVYNYDSYLILKEKQKYKCAICGIDEKDLHNSLAVDHNHITKKIRGLLCHLCNQAIGLLKDDPNILRKATEYLENKVLTN